jgi:uncharacterized protein YcbX
VPLSITLPMAHHQAQDRMPRQYCHAPGRTVVLERVSNQHSRAEIDPARVFGDAGGGATGTDSSNAPDFSCCPGTFFYSASIHVVASGTLAHLRTLIGDDAQLDPRRFRPNIVVETAPGKEGFLEDAWLEGTLEVGRSVRIVQLRPALRCVMTTHRQAELVRDLRILRTAAQHHHTQVGVFAAIDAPGSVGIGDSVMLVK